MASPPETLHGGARRLAVRWHPPLATDAPIGLSWYSVASGDRCSRHAHTGKTETWLLVSGRAMVELGDDSFEASPGDAFRAPPGVSHALTTLGDEPAVFVNVVERLAGVQPTTTELE
jgi:mannose-6-phosphate isomerase-like protein (cupin superfamily)